ncbi:uncharacterized protein UTRI_02294 [Ustilago trichophora]|uniref:Uncharacterized protein n=1 Tax=Ustilago trichophora TaxID=86804 RepID=A0A5C3E7A2_9BASI|nr:uncharacterized protein UTRI_02294 [Ustilago trichophora]
MPAIRSKSMPDDGRGGKPRQRREGAKSHAPNKRKTGTDNVLDQSQQEGATIAIKSDEDMTLEETSPSANDADGQFAQQLGDGWINKVQIADVTTDAAAAALQDAQRDHVTSQRKVTAALMALQAAQEDAATAATVDTLIQVNKVVDTARAEIAEAKLNKQIARVEVEAASHALSAAQLEKESKDKAAKAESAQSRAIQANAALDTARDEAAAGPSEATAHTLSLAKGHARKAALDVSLTAKQQDLASTRARSARLQHASARAEACTAVAAIQAQRANRAARDAANRAADLRVAFEEAKKMDEAARQEAANARSATESAQAAAAASAEALLAWQRLRDGLDTTNEGTPNPSDESDNDIEIVTHPQSDNLPPAELHPVAKARTTEGGSMADVDLLPQPDRDVPAIDTGIFKRLTMLAARTEQTFASSRQAVVFQPVQVYPAVAAIDFPFTNLPDPGRNVNIAAWTHRFRFEGGQISAGLVKGFRQEIASQLCTLLNLAPGKETFTVERPENINRSVYVDIRFTNKEHMKMARNAGLTWGGRPLRHWRSGAPLPQTQLFIRATGLSVSADPGALLQYFICECRFLTVKGMWWLKDGDNFVGTAFILVEFRGPFDNADKLKGFIEVEDREVELKFKGRRNFCLKCRANNEDGHVNSACRRRSSKQFNLLRLHFLSALVNKSRQLNAPWRSRRENRRPLRMHRSPKPSRISCPDPEIDGGVPKHPHVTPVTPQWNIPRSGCSHAHG